MKEISHYKGLLLCMGVDSLVREKQIIRCGNYLWSLIIFLLQDQELKEELERK